MSRMTVCISCKGDGRLVTLRPCLRNLMRCATCHGAGRIKYSEALTLDRQSRLNRRKGY